MSYFKSSGTLRDKTMNDKLIVHPNYDMNVIYVIEGKG